MDSNSNDVEKPKLAGVEKAIEAEMHEDVANEATDLEHKLSVREAFSIYPMAAVWSMLFCVCIIMDGYGRFSSNWYRVDRSEHAQVTPTNPLISQSFVLTY